MGCWNIFREHVPGWKRDRWLYIQIKLIEVSPPFVHSSTEKEHSASMEHQGAYSIKAVVRPPKLEEDIHTRISFVNKDYIVTIVCFNHIFSVKDVYAL